MNRAQRRAALHEEHLHRLRNDIPKIRARIAHCLKEAKKLQQEATLLAAQMATTISQVEAEK